MEDDLRSDDEESEEQGNNIELNLLDMGKKRRIPKLMI